MALHKVDVHHHVYPPVFTAALQRAGGDPSGWYIPQWTIEADRELCATVGARAAILSVTAPGPAIEPDAQSAAKLARECNEFCARLRDDDPDHYGFFASVPSLFDTELVLNEIRYALSELRADGVTLFTSYADPADSRRQRYLGDDAFVPVWRALSELDAVVFVHPTHSSDTSLVHPSLPQPMFDYPHETGRAAMSLLLNGRMRKEATRCKIILSHAGGTLPYLIYRAAGLLPHSPVSVGKSTEELVAEAQEFYFDSAISANPVTLKALFAFAKPRHVLFGTDFPNAPRESIQYFTAQLDEYMGSWTDEEKHAIAWKSAAALFPKFSL